MLRLPDHRPRQHCNNNKKAELKNFSLTWRQPYTWLEETWMPVVNQQPLTRHWVAFPHAIQGVDTQKTLVMDVWFVLDYIYGHIGPSPTTACPRPDLNRHILGNGRWITGKFYLHIVWLYIKHTIIRSSPLVLYNPQNWAYLLIYNYREMTMVVTPSACVSIITHSIKGGQMARGWLHRRPHDYILQDCLRDSCFYSTSLSKHRTFHIKYGFRDFSGNTCWSRHWQVYPSPGKQHSHTHKRHTT